MPRVPLAESRERRGKEARGPRFGGGDPDSPLASFGGIAEGSGSAAEALLAQRQQRDEQDFVGSQLAAMNARWTEEFTRRMAETEPGSPDFLANLVKDFDKDVSEGKKRAPSIEVGRQLEDSLADLRNRLVERGASFEGVAKAEQRQEALQSGLAGLREVAARDPGLLDHVLGEGEKLFAGLDGEISPQRLSALRRAWRRETTEVAIEARIRSDPEGARQRIEGGSWDEVLPKERLERLRKTAERETQELRLARQADLSSLMEADLESIERTGISTLPDLGPVAEAFGEEAATAFEGRRRLAREFHERWKEIAFLPEAEVKGKIEAMKDDSDAPGFVFVAHLHGRLAEALEERNGKLRSDPAGYVLDKAREKAEWLLQGLDIPDNERSVREYNLRVALQRELGVGRPSVFTKAEAGEVLTAFREADAETRVELLKELHDRTGDKHYRTALRDLGKAGLSPAQLMAAGFQGDPEKEHLRETLSIAIARPKEESRLSKEDRNLLDSETRAKFRKTKIAQYLQKSDPLFVFADMENATVQLASLYAKVSQFGAADQAVTELWGDEKKAEKRIGFVLGAYPATREKRDDETPKKGQTSRGEDKEKGESTKKEIEIPPKKPVLDDAPPDDPPSSPRP
jgi:hypothetical protein